MIITKHRFRYGIKNDYPDAKIFKGWEGGCAYKAIKEGKFYIIIDEGMMADFLDENDSSDKQALNKLVQIIQFDDEKEMEKYIYLQLNSEVTQNQKMLRLPPSPLRSPEWIPLGESFVTYGGFGGQAAQKIKVILSKSFVF